MFLRIIFVVLIVCQDLVLTWSLCQLLFSVVRERDHALRPICLCSDWSKFDRWVHTENLCNILKLVYCDSWSWQSFVSTCHVFNCLFLLDVRNEIQLLSRVFCYSWLVCLLGFWLRNTSPVKVGNPISDGIDSFSFFTLLDWKVWSDVASRSCLSNYCICVCFFFHISNFMKPSAVYEAIVYACLN